MPMTPAQRSLRSRLAAHTLHATHDSRSLTEPARKAFLNKFEREVDPEGVLPVTERHRRAEHARKAYMARLALKSAQARAARSSAR
jgi:hypothetical protein